MAEPLIDFKSALSELQMSEEELSNLVARGDLRVIRSGGKPMFDPSDITNLRKNRETEPTIVIPSGGAAPPPTDSQITIDLPDSVADETAATVVTAAVGSLETGTEEIVFESDLEVLPLEDGSATVIAGDSVTQVDEVEVIEEGPEAAPEVSARSAPGEPSRRMAAAYDVRTGHPAFAVALIVFTLIMIFTGSVLIVMLWKGYSVPYESKDGTRQEIRYVPGFLRGMEQGAEKWGEQDSGEYE